MLVRKLADSGNDIVGGQWPKIGQTEARCNWCESWWQRQYLRKYKSDRLQICRPSWEAQSHFWAWSDITYMKSDIAAGRRSTNRYDVETLTWVCMKSVLPTQNAMPITMKKSESKPEVEFRYGGRPFSKKTKIVITHRNLVFKYISTFLNE